MRNIIERYKKKYESPPGLQGYTYTPHEAREARNNGRLLAIRVETNSDCNLNCRYCYALSGGKEARRADFGFLKDTISQAHEMGARSIVVIGGGEPTIYPDFENLVEFISGKGMIPVVFSNTLAITRQLADFLYRSNASVMGKLDSLHPFLQDFFAGKDGASKMIRNGLDNLLEAGFGIEKGEYLRLGISFVSNRLNLVEIPIIWRFCRDRGTFPNMEILTPTGRAKDLLNGISPDTKEIKQYKMILLKIDREVYGYDWLPYTPLAGSGCLQHLYSLYVTLDGNIRPCAPVKFDQHPDFLVNDRYPYSLHSLTLKEIYDSEPFVYARHIDQHLEGKCGECEHHEECIGCRGYAFSVGINNGLSAYDALKSECLQCFK